MKPPTGGRESRRGLPPLPVRGERNENEMEVRRKKWRGRGEGGSGRGGIIDADMCSSLGGSNP